MKNSELILLSYLRQNSRMSLTKLSRKTGIPVSTIFDKIKRSSVIKKHVSLLNFGLIGFSIKVSILMKVDNREEAAEHLQKFFNINSLFKVNNGYDFLIEAIFHDLKELEDFLDAIARKVKIRKKEVFYIVEEIKNEEFLADPDLIEYVVNA